MDEVFDEIAEDTKISDTEWRKLKSSHQKDGFRDGVERGKNLHLQKGFDAGFDDFVKLSYRLGELRGNLSAFLVVHMKAKRETVTDAELEKLLKEISSYEHSLSEQLPVTFTDTQDLPNADQQTANAPQGLRSYPLATIEVEKNVSIFEERWRQLREKFLIAPSVV